MDDNTELNDQRVIAVAKAIISSLVPGGGMLTELITQFQNEGDREKRQEILGELFKRISQLESEQVNLASRVHDAEGTNISFRLDTGNAPYVEESFGLLSVTDHGDSVTLNMVETLCSNDVIAASPVGSPAPKLAAANSTSITMSWKQAKRLSGKAVRLNLRGVKFGAHS